MRPAVEWPSALVVVRTPNIAGAFLHDDGEDHTLLDANLGALEHGVPDAADVFAGVASGEHLRLVEVEDLLERFPLRLWREIRGGPGVPSKAIVMYREIF